MNAHPPGVALGPLSTSIRCSAGHRVDALIRRSGYLPGDSLHRKGGMWESDVPEAETMRFCDWLLLNYPARRPLPSPGPAVVVASQERAARAAA